MKKVYLSTLSMLVLFLSGCSSSVLECNDSKAKETAIAIISNEVFKAAWANDASSANILKNFSVSNIRIIDTNPEFKYNRCSATFNYQVHDKIFSKPFEYELAYLEDQKDTQVTVYGADDIMINMMVRVGMTPAPKR